jgi:hypothetical protein
MTNLLAQSPIGNPVLGPTLQTFLADKSGTSFFSNLLPRAVALLFVAGALIFFFMFIWGGIQWISSGGDKQGLESARGRITNAIIGLVILFAALAIIKFIESFFGVSILTLDIRPLIIQ